MATVSFYLDTRRMLKNGEYPIKLYIRHIGQIIIGTKFSAKKENWLRTEYSRKEPNYQTKNSAIRNLANKVEQTLLYLEMSDELKTYSDKRLKAKIEEVLFGNQKKATTLIKVFDEFVSAKSNRQTKDIYSLTRKKIMQFDADCTLEQIDNKWLARFDTWLAQTMKVNSRAVQLRNIRAVFNYALNEEYTKNYPFRKFSIKQEETRKRCLTVEQLRTLRDYPCEGHRKKCRDIFMLMFYLIGINTVDLLGAKKSDVVNGRLEYKRSKTGKLYSIKIEPEAMEIINRYPGKKDNLLDIMDMYDYYRNYTPVINIALKRIGGGKGKKPLFPEISCYWSRHTWATLAAELEIPIETISHALGHNIGSEITAIYIQFNRKKVDEANRKVIDFVNGGNCRE